MADREADFNNRLIQAFGYPYQKMMLPLKVAIISKPRLIVFLIFITTCMWIPRRCSERPPPSITEFTVTVSELNVAANGSLNSSNKVVKFHLADNGLGL